MSSSRAMRTAGPATGPTHPRRKFRKAHLDPTLPRLRFLGIENPADPFVACERRDIFPNGVRRGRVHERLPPIRRHAMHDATGDPFCGLTHNPWSLSIFSRKHTFPEQHAIRHSFHKPVAEHQNTHPKEPGGGYVVLRNTNEYQSSGKQEKRTPEERLKRSVIPFFMKCRLVH